MHGGTTKGMEWWEEGEGGKGPGLSEEIGPEWATYLPLSPMPIDAQMPTRVWFNLALVGNIRSEFQKQMQLKYCVFTRGAPVGSKSEAGRDLGRDGHH